MTPLVMPHYTDSHPVCADSSQALPSNLHEPYKDCLAVKLFSILEAVPCTEKTWASVTDR